MCSHRSPRGDRRCLKEEYFPLFVLFVLFGQAKRTLKEKNHKETFSFSYFCMTKRRVQGGEATSERRRRDGVYQKSYKRAFLPLIYLLPRARVSRTSHAWRVHAARDKSKVSGFALPTISAIPRVRTYHTKEPSRFVHALSARPLKNVWRAWAEPVRQRKQGFSPAFSCGELTDSRKRTRSASPRQGQKGDRDSGG